MSSEVFNNEDVYEIYFYEHTRLLFRVCNWTFHGTREARKKKQAIIHYEDKYYTYTDTFDQFLIDIQGKSFHKIIIETQYEYTLKILEIIKNIKVEILQVYTENFEELKELEEILCKLDIPTIRIDTPFDIDNLLYNNIKFESIYSLYNMKITNLSFCNKQCKKLILPNLGDGIWDYELDKSLEAGDFDELPNELLTLICSKMKCSSAIEFSWTCRRVCDNVHSDYTTLLKYNSMDRRFTYRNALLETFKNSLEMSC